MVNNLICDWNAVTGDIPQVLGPLVLVMNINNLDMHLGGRINTFAGYTNSVVLLISRKL